MSNEANVCGANSTLDQSWYQSKLDLAIESNDYTLASVILYRIAEKNVSDLLAYHFPFSQWDLAPYHHIADVFMAHKQMLFPGSQFALPMRPGFSDKLIFIKLLLPESIDLEQVARVIEQAETRHQSWLIHGESIITREVFMRMQRDFEPVLTLPDKMVRAEK